MANKPNPAPTVAVVGAGAVGSYFGGMLARSGVPVTLIARPPHVEAIRRDGLLLETTGFTERIVVAADSDIGAARNAQLVLVCVKTVATEATARLLAPHLAPGATVLSFQNGVDNVERMQRAAAIDAIPAVVYVAVEMAAPGHVRHSARGDLLIGFARHREPDTGARRTALGEVAQLFEQAAVPCRVVDDIGPELWTKLAMNCAYNAISALTRSCYGRMVAHDKIARVMRRLVEETLSVARASDVRLPEAQVREAVEQLGRVMPDATSSMAQDVARGRRTEIDALNGFIAREGARLGIPVPVNQTLHALVTLLETGSAANAEPALRSAGRA